MIVLGNSFHAHIFCAMLDALYPFHSSRISFPFPLFLLLFFFFLLRFSFCFAPKVIVVVAVIFFHYSYAELFIIFGVSHYEWMADIIYNTSHSLRCMLVPMARWIFVSLGLTRV